MTSWICYLLGDLLLIHSLLCYSQVQRPQYLQPPPPLPLPPPREPPPQELPPPRQWTIQAILRLTKYHVYGLWSYRSYLLRCWLFVVSNQTTMTSSNGNIFRVTGPLCGEFTGPGEFPTQRPVTRSFDVFFDLRLNKPLSKQPWGWWFETLSRSLWRHRNANYSFVCCKYDHIGHS